MADNIQINLPDTLGKIVSTTEAGDGSQHENVIAEYINGGGQPVKVSATTPLPVISGKSSTSAVTSVNDAASSQTLLALNTDRTSATIFNDSTEILYLKLGATASLTSFTVKIQPDGYYEVPQPIYTGVIDGIWANNASGAARITELTP